MTNPHMTVEGTVLSLIYKNDESGYKVARMMQSDGTQLTIVGIMPFLGAGELIFAEGEMVNNPQHGNQFSVESYERKMHSGAEGMYA